MFKLLTTVATGGSMLGHNRHHQKGENHTAERPHHMKGHDHPHFDGPQPPRRHAPPPEDIMEDRREERRNHKGPGHGKHHRRHRHRRHRHEESDDDFSSDDEERECPIKKFAKWSWHTFVQSDETIDYQTFLGSFSDKYDYFTYGAWSTYIKQLDLIDAQECLHAQLMIGIDYDYSIMQMWKGESQKVKWEGVYRFVNTAIADAQIEASCKNPFTNEKKIMAKNWYNGQERFFTGKTFKEDKPEIIAHLRTMKALLQNDLYERAGQSLALAYLSWTGLQIDEQKIPDAGFKYDWDQSSVDEKGTQIISGIFEGLFDIKTSGQVNEQCWSGLSNWLFLMDETWINIEDLIVKDIEQGFYRQWLSIASLPKVLQNCEGYGDDLQKLEDHVEAFGIKKPEFKAQMHEYMKAHGRDPDVFYLEAMHGFAKADWNQFGFAIGRMMQ